MTYCYLDTETVGLSLLDHDIWEVAWAIDDDAIHSGLVPHSRENADPIALTINGYDRRCDIIHPEEIPPIVEHELENTLRYYQSKGTKVTLVGANPAFDAYRLSRRWGWVEPWHYRMVDVSVYAMPFMGVTEPKGLVEVADFVRRRGWEVPVNDHTAAGDVACVRAAFVALQLEYKNTEVPF